jgi:hypothetical protein
VGQDSEHFFATLPELSRFAEVVDAENYTQIPSDWHLLLTDVRGSTQAIEQGRYRDVNALGAASIIAVRNAVPEVEVPFVFGGDGATLLVPSAYLAACETALRGLRQIAQETFNLELRCGLLPVATLQQAGLSLGVARFRVSKHVVLAMFMGNGFAEAERRIKAETTPSSVCVSEDGPAHANLEGFECRWQPIANKRGSILALLVTALPQDSAQKSQVYRELLQNVERVLGEGQGHPVSRAGLALRAPWGDFSIEARLKSASTRSPAFDAAYSFARRRTLIGKLLVAMGSSLGGFDGSRYPLELIQNCDFRKFDDTLRMVVDVSEAQFEALRVVLERGRDLGNIAYGMHRSSSALMTCFVRSYNGDHVHFVDGADGGYALAARQLKAQLQSEQRA